MATSKHLLGGRYELGDVLGYGGMAEVRRGRDVRLGRDVAVKTLRSDLARDPTFQSRFRREAQSAASLNHPAIVAVYDTGEDTHDGVVSPYIVMEYVQGRTLRQVLESEGRLLPQRALEITAQICTALDQAHRAGIVHRDVKPGNVMLTPTGEVKVMDFGIARALTSSAATMTQTAAVIGTAHYLSPEQARGEHVDARSDVYSAGCMLYELLTGAPPFAGDTAVAVAYQHVREDPVPPSRVESDVTAPLDAIVLKAMAKNPANRYQTAADMRADIERALAGRPVEATPVLAEDNPVLGPSPATTVLLRQQRPRAGRAAAYIGLAAATIAVFLIALVVARNLLSGGSSEVNTPNVVGQTEADARAILAGKGLHVGEVTEEYSTKYAQGIILKQDPAADILLKKGDGVSIVVSKGVHLVLVPDGLVGLSEADARRALKAANLKVAQVVPQNSDQPVGQVLTVDPPAGSQVAIGSGVSLTVSNGQVKVPNVVGQKVADARAALVQAGFQVTLDPETSPENAKVISQNPAPGSFVGYGSDVTLRTDAPSPTPTPSPSESTSPSPEPSESVSPTPSQTF
jgi:eukaryotic-like serine/threonine-protein kinase